jgi:hypothetical protein
MRILSTILLLSVAGLFSSCASLKTSGAADDEIYREDLSVHRDRYSVPEDTVGTERLVLEDYSNVTPTEDITMSLNDVLDASDAYKTDVEFVDGYTIQIYTGSSSDDARKLRGKAISLMDDENVELYYDEPNFKVKVGQYYSRLEAQKDYTRLKEEFPMAIVIPDKIPVP